MIILDTQVVTWLVRQPSRLSSPARRAIEKEGVALLFQQSSQCCCGVNTH